MVHHILIVEDNPLNLELAQDILEIHGFHVDSVGDGTECLQVLKHTRPDLVLMDIQLPGKDGLEITRELRADPRTADLLIVAMTAHAMPEDKKKVMDAGCNGYLIKPIQTRTLAMQVEAFIVDSRKPGGHPDDFMDPSDERAGHTDPGIEDTGATTS